MEALPGQFRASHIEVNCIYISSCEALAGGCTDPIMCQPLAPKLSLADEHIFGFGNLPVRGRRITPGLNTHDHTHTVGK